MGKKIHYAGADGVRGLACLIVLCVHAAMMFFTNSSSGLAGTGKIGVWLFFVLSAFLLTCKFAAVGFSFYSIATYALGRVVRIIPLFSLVAGLYYLLGTAQINTLADLVSAVTMKQGFVHLWTIPVEFKFYAVLPIIAFALLKAKQRGGHFSVLLLAVALVVAQQWLWPYWETAENSVSTRGYLSSFTIGCYFAASFDFFQARITPRVATCVGLAVIALMVLSSPYMRYIFLDMPMDKWLQDKFIYLSLLWGIFVVALADGKGRIGAILQSKVMKKLGAWSFSIYLVHWYFYMTFGVAHPNSVLWMIIGIACAVACGAFLHYVVEAPIEKFRHSLQIRIWSKSAAAA